MSKGDIVWFIDEDPDELTTYGELLSKIFETYGKMIAIEPKTTIEEMKFIIDEPKTISIVIDEQLKTTGIAQFLGIELAKYFRILETKLPIYILTNHSVDSSDLKAGEWSVEYILRKDEFEANFDIIKARMRRNVSFYHDYLDKREERFNDLLNKSLHSTISKEEIKEFEELQYIRSKSTAADELGFDLELNDKIEKHLAVLSELKKEDKKGSKHE